MQRPDPADLRFQRDVERRRHVHESSVLGGGVRRRVRAGHQAVLEQRRADVRSERHLGQLGCLCFVGMRWKCLYRGMRARRDAMLGQRRANLFDERPMGHYRRLHESSVCNRRVRRRLQPRRQAMQQSDAANLRRERHLAKWHRMYERLQQRRVFGHL